MIDNWINISSNFTPKLQKEWEDRKFSYEECKEWLDIGLEAIDYSFCSWLRDELKTTAEEVLNIGDLKKLRKHFDYFLQTEEIITKILLNLDGWKDKVSGQEKKAVQQVIRKLAKNWGSKKEQKKATQDLLNDYPTFQSKELESCLEQWTKILEESEKIPPLWKEKEPEDPFTPDWLYDEKPEDKKKPTKPPKPPKTSKPLLPKQKPWECRICDKNVFHSRQEFFKAHVGKKQGEPSVWVYKTVVICKKPIITKSMWVCKICKQENHTDKCKYYSPPRVIVTPPEIFDWESYWKWWFGVFELDWDSSRFFG